MYGEAFFNLVLIGASCNGLYALKPAEHPYCYITAAFCLIHGFLALLRTFGSDDECSRSFIVSCTVVDVLPLPMANIQFYLKSSMSEVALVHALSIILLVYDIMGSLGDDWDQTTEMLKDLSLLANVASAIYIGQQEENQLYVIIAVLAIIARYGSSLVSMFLPDVGPYVEKLSKASMLVLMTYALTNKE